MPSKVMLSVSVLMTAIAAQPTVAQTASAQSFAASASDKATVIVRAPQRWEQSVRFACLEPRTAPTFERHVNQQVTAAGQQGYELVSSSPGRFNGQDCVALVYRRPARL